MPDLTEPYLYQVAQQRHAAASNDVVYWESKVDL